MKKQTISALLLSLGALIFLSISISFLQMYLESKNLGENFIHPLGKAIDKFIGKKNFSGDEIPVVIVMFFIISIALIVSARLIYRKKDNNVGPTLYGSTISEGINGEITINVKNDKSLKLPLNTFFKVNKDFYFATNGENNKVLMKIDSEGNKEILNNTTITQKKSTNIGNIDLKFTIAVDIKNFKILQSIKIKENDGQENYLLIDQNANDQSNKKRDNFYLLEKNNKEIIGCSSGFLWKNVEKPSIGNTDVQIPVFSTEIDDISKSTNPTNTDHHYQFRYGKGSESLDFSITMKTEKGQSNLYIDNNKVAPHLSKEQIDDIQNQLGKNSNQTHTKPNDHLSI